MLCEGEPPQRVSLRISTNADAYVGATW